MDDTEVTDATFVTVPAVAVGGFEEWAGAFAGDAVLLLILILLAAGLEFSTVTVLISSSERSTVRMAGCARSARNWRASSARYVYVFLCSAARMQSELQTSKVYVDERMQIPKDGGRG